MAERDLACATLAARSPHCAAVQLALLPPATRLIIRGDIATLGLPVPAVCRAVEMDSMALLWLGPDEVLLLSSDGPPVLAPCGSASIVDVSHRDVALRVSGSRAAWAINAFCALDLHPASFPVGMCTRTIFAKAQIVLWRCEAEVFRIEVARSFAPYVWACLEEARREFLD